ncbi:MAG TPA: AsmA family protein [Bryocella sp.]|nr:AsmA family protein [Bryocella sp.]
MRKLVIAVAIVVIVIAVVALVLPHIIDVNQYRGEIQSQLQQRLNRPVQLGELSLGLFPVRIEANNVAIGEDPSFHSNVPFAQVEQLNVSVKLLPLLSKNVEIDSLELKRPKIELIKNPQGVWNFSTIASSPSNAPAAPAANKPPEAAKPAPSSPGGAGNQISLGELKISDGQIAVTDEQKRQPRAVYDHIDLTLKNFAPGEPFSVDLAAHLPGSGSQKLTLTGDGGPINNADAAKTPFKGKLNLDGVSMAGLQQFLNSKSLEGTDASITGTTDLSNENGAMSANGSMKFEDVVVHGTKVGYPITTDFDVTENSANDSVDIKKFATKVGSTSLTAQGTMTQYSTPSPNIDATVSCPNAKVDELLSLAQVFGVSAADGMTGSGNITLNVTAKGPVNNTGAMQLSGSGALQNVTLKPAGFTKPMQIRTANIQFAQNSMNLTNLAASLGSTNATGNASVTNFQSPHITFALSADKINVTELEQITGGSSQPAQKRARASWSLVPTAEAAPASQPGMLQTATGNGTLTVGTITYEQTVLTNVHSTVALNHGVIQLNPLTSNIFGGQQSGSITVDTRPNPMTYAANIKLANADANKLLSSVSSVKDTVYGTLGVTTNVTFATPPSGNVAQTLNGTVAMTLANGKIMKLDLPGELSKIGKFGGVQPKGYTAISQMTGTFNLHNGVAQTNDLKAALDIGTMAATGTMNLVNQGLNMHVTAVLNKGFSQSVGGTGVGGYLNTALANKNGELVIPVLVTGSMDHPLVAPDVQEIAKMKVNNLLPTAGGLLSGKGGNVGGLVGGLLGGQQSQSGKQGQQQQQNPLGGVLNGILGGKKH